MLGFFELFFAFCVSFHPYALSTASEEDRIWKHEYCYISILNHGTQDMNVSIT